MKKIILTAMALIVALPLLANTTSGSGIEMMFGLGATYQNFTQTTAATATTNYKKDHYTQGEMTTDLTLLYNIDNSNAIGIGGTMSYMVLNHGTAFVSGVYRYTFQNSNLAPYLIARIGYGTASSDENLAKGGLTFGGGIGVKLTPFIYSELRYDYLTQNGASGHENDKLTNQTVGVTVGMCF